MQGPNGETETVGEEVTVEDRGESVTLVDPHIEEAELVGTSEADENTQAPEDDFSAPGGEYESVDQLEINGGMLYVAVKHGYAIDFKGEQDEEVNGLVNITLSVTKVEDGTGKAYTFANDAQVAKEFFDALTAQGLEGVDVEVEIPDASQFVSGALPKRMPKGYRKPPRVRTLSQATIIKKRQDNQKSNNRKKNKQASKSRKKNRR